MSYRIEVRDRDLNRVGVIDTWIKLDFIVRFCQQGSFQMLVKAGTDQANLLQKGGGIAIFQEGVPEPLLTGQIEFFQDYWTVEQHTGEGSLYVGGKCDNKIAYSRLALPEPAVPVSQQYTARATRQAAGSASTALWWELEHSVGASALPDRRIPGLSLPFPEDLGAQVNDSLRFDVLGTTFERWTDSKELGYRFIYNPDLKKIELRIYKPRDRSRDVRFSPDLGNLREYIWTLTAPRVTRAIVACQGEGDERYLYQQIDSEAEAEWGLQIEQFYDRRDLPLKTDPATGQPVKSRPDTTDAEFENAKKTVVDTATSALQQGEKSGNFQIYPIDTEQQKFGRDYFVGDLVTVSVNGVDYVDIVREVNISIEDAGKSLTIRPKIGEQGTGDPLNLYKTVSELREKLRKLEARM
ncbi:siphovirus ReqiPepy6 Gp37-like family protein [Kitasatospora purpeofusca]|uniref:siphovirus ReqiPepy6 Gp37-like family protein n=1 Tax=Kitasatospora purpeofusca TaxID=67352 RepID=UPI002253545E|nr:siphovirus ReqiPepy6 Gp37-like family protein [Kitasatospora purpeofusca]MCX4685475.1 siphovirus ReqiPepy6 Gp37-like family protein [Kitasatospora purpeofusca]